MRGKPTGFWAKLDRDEQGNVCAWHPVVDHCADVAACCEALLTQTLLGDRLAALAGQTHLEDGQVARLAALAALHDVGKFNNGFQNKVFADRLPRNGHVREVTALVGSSTPAAAELFAALQADTLIGWAASEEAATSLLLASICHHGRPIPPAGESPPGIWEGGPDRGPLDGVRELSAAVQRWFPEAFAENGPHLPGSPRFHHAFSGLVMLADWLGSDTRLFPFAESTEDRMPFARAQASASLEKLGVDTWRARSTSGLAAPFPLTFGFPPRPVQQELSGLAVPDEASITILEAETGSGKTEAALHRFLQLFHAGRVDGVYFALPTRTAATQIHRRVVRAIAAAFPDEALRPPVTLAVPGYLAVDDSTGQRLPGFNVLWNDSEQERARQRGWAAEHPKRYLAASIAVGTIDQVLLSALRVSHSHLRGTSLLRHLLIVDEVHASDAYMTRLLRSVLDRHYAAGGHALLMSATLGSAAREPLLVNDAAAELLSHDAAVALPYPLVSNQTGGNTSRHHPVAGAREKAIAITLARDIDDPRTIAELGLQAAAAGAAVLIIRNTVADCVATQIALEDAAEEHGETAVLFRCGGVPAPHHSRFAKDDRTALDDEIERALGKARGLRGVVAVATQTVQQSLDLDADFMITDLCPVDVLLQRMGRLHRHERNNRPDAYANARTVVLIPNEDDLGTMLSDDGSLRGRHGFGTVYEDLRVLEATLRCLGRYETWRIPTMNRSLVEAATHPECLDAIAEQGGPQWQRHGQKVLGTELSHRRHADRQTVSWKHYFFEPECAFDDGLSERAKTRLGAGDRLVTFPEPPRGPFGNRVCRLTIPAWMAGDVSDTELEASDVMGDGSVIEFSYGGAQYIYDRLGLRRTP